MFLYQPPTGYCYNSDSIFLYDFIRQFPLKGRLLDVGCGVGILSLLLSRDFGTETVAVDKQPLMCAYAKHNFALNGIDAQVHCVDFADFESEERFDYIVSNPPFYDPNVDQSTDTMRNIARYAHHLPLETLVKNVKRLLKPRGYFIFCYDAKQLDRIMTTLCRYALNPEKIRFVHAKIDRESKLVFVAARQGSKSMCTIQPPLIVFDEKSRYLPEAAQAFKHAATHSIKAEREAN